MKTYNMELQRQKSQSLIFPQKSMKLQFWQIPGWVHFGLVLAAASLLSRLTKGNWDFRRGGRCYQPNAVIAWRIPAEHTTGFRRLICDDHRNDNTNCDYDNTNNCKEIFIALEIVHHECPNFIHCEKKVVISWLILVSAHPQSVSK